MIDTPPSVIYNYVCNPNSWPEWLAASHHIDGEDRPLRCGETFREQWHIKRGEVRLAWTVTESDPPKAWTVEADTDFIGRIVVRYTFEATANGTKYTRTLRNPDRPSAPSPEQIARMDEEAVIGLEKHQAQCREALPFSGLTPTMTAPPVAAIIDWSKVIWCGAKA